MGLLAKCPKCGTMTMAGATCPECHYSDNPEVAAKQDSYLEEYQRRKKIHTRNYAIFMGCTMGLAGVTLVLGLLLFLSRRGRRFGRTVARPRLPQTQPDFGGEEFGGEGYDDDMAMEMPEMPLPQDIPAPAPADTTSLMFLLLFLLLGVSWLVLAFLSWKCRQWWPIGLHCPSCNNRLDELGGDSTDHCPGCSVRLK